MFPSARSSFVLISIISCVKAFDYNNLRNNWRCSQNGTVLGNFPAAADFRSPLTRTLLSTPADQWTTFPVANVTAPFQVDDKRQQIAQPWPNSSEEPIGFYVRPRGSGFRNRIIVQLALHDRSPIEPPYPKGTFAHEFDPVNDSHSIFPADEPAFDVARLRLQQGLFNCHVNRKQKHRYGKFPPDFPTSVQEDVERLYDNYQRWEDEFGDLDRCQDEYDHDEQTCLEGKEDTSSWDKEIKSRAREVGCTAGTQFPICCYVTFQKELRRIRSSMGRDLYDFNSDRSCLISTRRTSIDDFKTGQCKVATNSNWTKVNLEAFYSNRSEIQCNKHTSRSFKSCREIDELSIEEAKKRNRTFPCVASCYKSMVLQIEIVPVEEDEAKNVTTEDTSLNGNPSSTDPSLFITAAIRRFTRLSQPPFNVSTPRFFGFHMPNKTRTDYLGVPVESSNSDNIARERMQLSTKKITGIWLKWVDRSFEADVGPLIQIGVEGSSEPVVNHDLSRSKMYIGSSEEGFGFRYGWRGVELQRPRVGAVFAPRYVTLNTVEKAAGFEYVSSSSLTKCRQEREENDKLVERFSPASLALAGVGAVLLLAIGFGAYFGYRNFRKKHAASAK